MSSLARIMSTTLVLFVLLPLAAVAESGAPLSFGERLATERAIQDFYQRGRINASAEYTERTQTSGAIPDDAIRDRVAGMLVDNVLLARLTGKGVTRDDLQREMNRMARDTRAPERLRSLFAALANDPVLIAECIARPVIVRQRLRALYTGDREFHERKKRRILGELARATGFPLIDHSGTAIDTLYLLQGTGGATSEPVDAVRVERIEDRTEWAALIDEIAARFSTSVSAGPGAGGFLPPLKPLAVGSRSGLDESDEQFFVVEILESSPGRLRIRQVGWPKETFETWRAERLAGDYPIDLARPTGGQAFDWLAGEAGFSNEGGEPLLTPEITGSGCSNDTWKTMATFAPTGRRRHTAVWSGTEMIIWGGKSAPNAGRYNTANRLWSPVSTDGAPPLSQMFHSAIWTGSEMIVWGGSTSEYLGARYDPAIDDWTALSTLGAPTPRRYHTAVWTGTEMIVWGGQDVSGASLTGGRYNPATDTWIATRVDSATPSPRYYHTAVWTGTEMIIWGGSDGTSPLLTGSRYDPLGDSWQQTSIGTGLPAARQQHSAVWTGNRMIIWGGYSGYPLDSGAQYDPAGDLWTPMASTPPEGRYLHSTVWSGSRMIIWGGNGSWTSSLDTGASYDPQTDSWTGIPSASGSPSGRTDHTAVWTGTKMIVWGGFTLTGPAGTGAEYDPVTGTWEATTTGPPSARSGHTSIWTGAEVIVWGGGTNTGGRYDPVLDIWSPTSTSVNVPSARSYHSANWTGQEMIVWGGDVGTTQTNTGARYSPVTDSWATVSTGEGSPRARREHSAVWTGSDLLIWGGYSGGAYFSDGAIYTPSSDVWRPMSTPSPAVLAPRSRAPAIWTGTRMFVWGGFDGNGPLASGAKYTPVADTWEPSTATGAPSARYYHTSIWTGSEALIWGGSPSTNSGALYDPLADSWKPTSTSGDAPGPRESHSAAWTGVEMIVWGGFAGGSYLGDGARYHPGTDSWSRMSQVSAPQARKLQTGIWTGTQLVVWGGSNGVDLSDGALYCATCETGDWYRDADQDGFGDVNSPVVCYKPTGVSGITGDCDDSQPSVFPGAPSLCDGRNNDCSDPTWPAVSEDESDADTDGFRACNGECDDSDYTVYPGAPQNCDGVNNNCDDASWPAVPSVEADADQDGFRICAGDCRDDNWAVNPAAAELCDAADNDCDGLTDEGLAYFTYYRDSDGDTYGATNAPLSTCVSPAPSGYGTRSGDCNDGDALTYPGAWERCNGADDDCNGEIDDRGGVLDGDSDTVKEACDNCPSRYNADQRDEDLDGVGNVCDNCLVVANSDQGDLDGDVVGDRCDNCGGAYNPSQTDGDRDAVGDVCDNCIATRNESQHDLDGDATGDECDLDDGVVIFRKIDTTRVRWQSDPRYYAYNLYRGSLEVLRSTGIYTQEIGSNPYAARWCDLGGTYQDDLVVPAPGAAFYWIITGEDVSGEEPLGDGAGVERPDDHPCP